VRRASTSLMLDHMNTQGGHVDARGIRYRSVGLQWDIDR